MSEVLIGALSAQHNFAKREACRQTWASGNYNLDHRDNTVFMIGDRTAFLPRLEEGNILRLPCQDDYPSLPQKTKWFCVWALSLHPSHINGNWDYLFKCDDDTYVHQERLAQLVHDARLNGWDYVGHRLEYGHEKHLYASGGAGYLLSRKAVISVAGRQLEHRGPEDVFTGMVLKQAGIDLIHDERLFPWGGPVPRPDLPYITGHYVSPDNMRQTWGVNHAAVPARIPHIFHFIWLGTKPFPFQENIETWKQHHPHWEFRLWTDRDIPFLNLKLKAQFNDATTQAQRADILRYELLQQFGGVYVDCDFECRKPIDDLIAPYLCFSAYEDENSVAIGIMGAVPNHPLFEKVVNLVPSSMVNNATANIVCQTGPAFFTPLAQQQRIQLFPPAVFYPVHYCGRVMGPLEDAYAIHQWAHSWREGS